MRSKKRGFFERLTGSMRIEEEEEEIRVPERNAKGATTNEWIEEENEEAELSVDVYQTNNDIVIQTMVAGVKPDDLDITIGRDMVTIKGKREETKAIDEDNYFTRELYWGKFSRTILLPQEVEPEDSEATEKQGLLTIKLPKIDKEKKATLKVKSV